MPLSEYEQRVLQQMEQQLRTEDPKLASDLGQRPRVDARRILLATALVVAGLAALLGGVSLSYVWLGVLGFALMLAGVMVIFGSPNRTATPRTGGTPKGGAPRPKAADGSTFMRRQAERWDRRQDGGQR